MVYIIYNAFVALRDGDDGEEAFFKRIVGWGMFRDGFVDKFFDDGFEEIRDVFIVIIESVAVDAAAIGDVANADFADWLLREKL